MNKELPKVFANKIDKKINNSQDIFYEEEKKSEINDVRNIGRKISDIFNSSRSILSAAWNTAPLFTVYLITKLVIEMIRKRRIKKPSRKEYVIDTAVDVASGWNTAS